MALTLDNLNIVMDILSLIMPGENNKDDRAKANADKDPKNQSGIITFIISYICHGTSFDLKLS